MRQTDSTVLHQYLVDLSSMHWSLTVHLKDYSSTRARYISTWFILSELIWDNSYGFSWYFQAV